ncbi:histidinol dehydrogenase [Alkalicoccus halolimnae]|uniref:Histidinol dehydrogenase n=1 Tax=Alkalicoccus halolimnae TaxID=1667239 RepID=A0A5C7F467_9BACI|nr:histidinol dehydrogenase [Alkalicoccus halolimnae]TXF84327.1 histidinol dehydrogenase [Alkalicoccus halolimnae]
MNIVSLEETPSLKRSIDQGTGTQREAVTGILQQVKERGDEAVQEYTQQFDKVTIADPRVTEEELSEAEAAVGEETRTVIREAIENIRDFHERQRQETWITTKEDGTILGQKITPLDAAGVYVPGGRAAYPSSIIMNVIPAQVAGVERIVMVSPPQENGKLEDIVLFTAKELGVKEIYKIGGAQAVAALTYGTKTIDPVDKITGPGNIFVALAKQLVYGTVDIDMIAGPSEVVVLADESGHGDYIAADLLSQAEHDPMSSAILVTTSRELAEETAVEVKEQLQTLPKKEIAEAAIRDHSTIYVADTLAQAIAAVNELAPEHLELHTAKPWDIVSKIKHAGAIFLGENSSEPIGDYFAGPNHVLPTNGTARFSSPLNVEDFTKKSSIISYSEQALRENGGKIAAFARLENLEAHARAIDIRLEKGAGHGKTTGS